MQASDDNYTELMVKVIKPELVYRAIKVTVGQSIWSTFLKVDDLSETDRACLSVP